MRKVRMFVWGDAVVATGFSRVLHSIIDNLPQDVYDVYWLGVNYYGDPHNYPYKIYPASSRGDMYGFNRLEELLTIAKPDLIFALNDPWGLNQFLELVEKVYENGVIPPTVIYFPTDAKGHNSEWYSRFDKTFPVVYTDFGLSVAQAARPDLNYSVIPHGVDYSKFFRMDKETARKEVFGENFEKYKDAFIVLNANRNQPRKRIDLTLKGFAQFAKDKPDNVHLYMHSGVVDSFINTIDLAVRLGIEKRLIISSKNDGPQQATIERLNAIYNACDIGINTSLGEGWGLCLHEDTTVWTREGLFKIKDVKPGMHVVSHTGKWRKVLNVIPTGVKKLIQFRTFTERVLKCSEDHLIMTNFGWKKAKDIKLGDSIQFVNPVETADDYEFDLAKDYNLLCDDDRVWYRRKTTGDYRTFKRFLSVKEDLSELIGTFLAWGSIVAGSAIIRTRTEAKAWVILEKLNAIGINTSSIEFDAKYNTPYVLIKEPFFVDFLAKNFGIKPKKCEVPDGMFNTKFDKLVYSFIETKYNTVKARVFFYTFSNKVSTFIAHQLYMMQIGVSVKLRRRSSGSYYAEVSKDSLPGIKTTKKPPLNTRVVNGKLYSKIKIIEEEPEAQTYDLNVEEDHSYCANGYVVHNCNVEHAVTGAPQIVPNHSACKELFEDCGILIPVAMEFTLQDIMTEGGLVSPDGVASALEKLYSNKPLYTRLSDYSFKKFNNETLSWKHLASVWHQVFMGVIDASILAE